jgi:hypothetical protein
VAIEWRQKTIRKEKLSLSRQKITLLGIFALFLGPVLLVILMQSSWWQYRPSGLKNHGLLVQPPVHLSLNLTQSTEGKWLILYVINQPCDQKCIESVTALRQIHRAAGKNSEHLAIVLLSETQATSALRSKLESIYPEFNFVTDSAATALNTLVTVKAMVTADSSDIRTYLLDPMLNVILAYGVSANLGDVHKDLKQLLKWSDQENRR